MPDKKTTRLPIIKINGNISQNDPDLVVRETPLTIFLNGAEFVTLVCSPANLYELALGFLCSEGILQHKKDLKKVALEEEKGIIQIETAKPVIEEEYFMRRYITSCCGKGRSSFYFINDARGTKTVTGNISISIKEIKNLIMELETRAKIFQTTGGTHGAGLCTPKEMLLFFEDIGRHNAVDKLFGRSFLDELQLEDKIIVFSGRVSSEILIKVAKIGIPIIISRSAPTDLAVKIATELGITVIGFARGDRMNIYTHTNRVKI
ncbi:formate dehydrogenase accessory sulfurtransferase FdhD [Desulfolucanica intricata]|uniref:formate dehydrogenase accessory sulfurtransferase FdhD n=1 Tax=Desulfolucanica intricata TaxID=1285191 RepID=UPI00082F8701|nr:formate dehydrogenase accessory sulfurtransferase FdhD [Desulfolucanica intricata]